MIGSVSEFRLQLCRKQSIAELIITIVVDLLSGPDDFITQYFESEVFLGKALSHVTYLRSLSTEWPQTLSALQGGH